ncbi:MAG: DUF1549 domain-containing protein [Verrucomicrobia bacterium]|nr:MAG: DUF1549 domain-containing protein [Verrucomicrobiota bacterium]
MGEGKACGRFSWLQNALSKPRLTKRQKAANDSPSPIRWERAGVRALLVATLCLIVFQSRAADITPAQTQFFENKIRPLLAKECYRCHSHQAERVKAGLYLDSREGMLKGGENGPAVLPGSTEKSLLVKAIRCTDADLQMPPKGKKLSDEQIADLESWVKMGAPDPRTEAMAAKDWKDSGKNHWAWQPLVQPTVPEAKDSSWCKSPVDKFIVARLEEKNLKPSPSADKRTLIRRATFDLVGLPPTPEEVDAFLKDESPDAFAKVVDRLLASPHYGERWGRHWLDVARYSDTKGQVRRQREDPRYPWAWTYRDYVIRSFNEDKPYNQFIVEQLAADKLPATKRNPTNLTALGFLTVGERFMGMQNDIINDRIDVVTKGCLGLTVTCARCHDHKFDPIPTKDYYSLHGVFASTVQPPVETVIEKIVETPAYREYATKRAALDAEADTVEKEFRAAQRQRNREAIKKLQRQFRQTQSEIADLEMTSPGAPMRAMAVYDSARPKNSPVLLRGEAGNLGPVVDRHFLEVLSGANRPAFTNGSGRLELAWAITSKNNPLTPRALVNRVWLHHFGEGFVPTPDDLGTMSEPPSHPELLDYLASRFVEGGWSLKKLHREIMLSSVYQQSSANNPRYAEVDPNNRLLWRANIRRLEFESVRDSVFAIGGTLDETMFGRPVDFEKHPESTRRTIYGYLDRSDVDDVMVNFDFANPDMPNGKRHETTVPQQALFFMNSPLVIEQAKRLVTVPAFTETTGTDARVRALYERIYQREPTPEEVALAVDFVAETPKNPTVVAGPGAAPNRPEARRAARPIRQNTRETSKLTPLTAWEKYAHALLQANELMFVN